MALELAVIFLIVAILVAVFGFRGLVGLSAGIAKLLVLVFLVLFVVSLFYGAR